MKHTCAALATASVIAGLFMVGPALAFQGVATAHLNIRSGPGPQYPIIAATAFNDPIEVHGCLKDVTWCDVNWGAVRGWAAAEYIAYDAPGEIVHLPSAGNALSIPLVTYTGVAAVVGEPVGAIVGVAFGAAAPVVAVPHASVHAYAATQTIEPVLLTGEVVIGAVLPTVVPLYAVPQSPYHLAVVNGAKVLVEQGSRRVVYIYR